MTTRSPRGRSLVLLARGVANVQFLLVAADGPPGVDSWSDDRVGMVARPRPLVG
jgi:hypothetical protein